MKNKLTHNWGLKLSSLVLAFAMWFLVAQFIDPQDSRSFGNIKVKLINTDLLEAENKVYEVLDESDIVKVTVRAPKSVLNNLRSSDVIAEADMSKLTDINTIVIRYDIQNANSESVEVVGNHDVVKLNVEEKASKYVAISYNVTGEPADGYMVGNINMDQNMIEISGPKSAVETVASAGVDINVNGAVSNLSANMEIKLYDSDGKAILNDNIEKQTDYARLSVEILATKEIPIRVEYVGEPASGYMPTGVVDINPQTVKIAGSTITLSNISEIFISDEAISIEGATENVEHDINIAEYLPGNVKLADTGFNGRIKATIHVEPVAQRTITVSADNFRFSNVPSEITALLMDGSDEYTIQVEGLKEEIDSLDEDSVRGIINVGEWMNEQELTRLNPGTYYIPADLELNSDVQPVNNLIVHVQIRKSDS